MTRNMICIGCPMGCDLTVETENGAAVSVSGNSCPIGKKYAETEVSAPTRMVTSTAKAENGTPVPVKTKVPVPKDKIFDVMKENEKEEPEGETEEDDGNEEDDSQKQVEGRRFMSLPGPGLEEAMNAPETDDEAEDDVIETEYREVEADGNGDDLDVPEEDGGDITVPDDTDIGEYEYQEPGEDDEEELIDEEEEPSWD